MTIVSTATTAAAMREPMTDIQNQPVGDNYSNMSAGGRRQNLDRKISNFTRSQWQHWMDSYQPMEQDLLNRAMQTDFSKEGDEAGQDAAAGVRASQGMLARNMSRMGSSMTPEQAAAVRRRSNLDMTKATGQAENTTRRTLSDTRTNLLVGLSNVGRQVAAGAMSGYQSAAGNAANTEMMLNQSRANANAQNMQTVMSLASLMFMV